MFSLKINNQKTFKTCSFFHILYFSAIMTGKIGTGALVSDSLLFNMLPARS